MASRSARRTGRRCGRCRRARPAASFRRVWLTLPGSQRCGICAAPFAGAGSHVARPLGYRPSRKNPTLCATCVEASPPGGTTMETGVLFADLRGFTSHSEGMDPSAVSALLRRFYGCAERVLFPEAVIDKLIGDEVMALYLPPFTSRLGDEAPAALMIRQARALLAAVGYGQRRGPVRRARHRPRLRRGVRRQHRRSGRLRLHGGRRRRQHRVAVAGPRRRRRDPLLGADRRQSQRRRRRAGRGRAEGQGDADRSAPAGRLSGLSERRSRCRCDSRARRASGRRPPRRPRADSGSRRSRQPPTGPSLASIRLRSAGSVIAGSKGSSMNSQTRRRVPSGSAIRSS